MEIYFLFQVKSSQVKSELQTMLTGQQWPSAPLFQTIGLMLSFRNVVELHSIQIANCLVPRFDQIFYIYVCILTFGVSAPKWKGFLQSLCREFHVNIITKPRFQFQLIYSQSLPTTHLPSSYENEMTVEQPHIQKLTKTSSHKNNQSILTLWVTQTWVIGVVTNQFIFFSPVQRISQCNWLC